MSVVRTVLGDIDAAALGRVNYHEHLFQISPLLGGDELDDEERSGLEAESLHASGFDTMIEATPHGLFRNAEGMARISAWTGLQVIATTGRHRDAHYLGDHPTRERTATQLAAQFITDIRDGMPYDDWEPDGPRAVGPRLDPVRAGILKAGIDYWSVSAFEHVTLEAVAAAHRETGAAVMVHLEFCTAAHEVLDLLAAGGVPADRVILAHADRDPDPGLHASLAERGAYLGYDGFARPRTRSDAELLDLTERAVAAGAGDRILLGGDVARRTRYVAYDGLPGLAYLGERYLPRLRDRIGTDAVDRMIITNPARVLPLHP